MEKWIYSIIQLDSEKITLFQEDQKTMKFEINLSKFLNYDYLFNIIFRIKSVGESLFPKIDDYNNYYSETSNNKIWTYNEYSDELDSFVTEYSSAEKTINFCRVFDEYSLSNSSLSVGTRSLYIICFLNEKILNHFISTAISKYTDFMGDVDLSNLNYVERGRSLGKHYL